MKFFKKFTPATLMLGALLSQALPMCWSAAYANEGVCKEITAVQSRMMDSLALTRLSKKPDELTHLEARLNRAFKGPINAMKDYLGGIDIAKKQEFLKGGGDTQSMGERFRKQVRPVADRHGLNNSECLFRNGCTSDGNDKASVTNTQYFKQLDAQFHEPGRPVVVSCNYERAAGRLYLSDEEVRLLRKDSPELAGYFATDMGWKNACLRVPFGADGKAAIFDWKKFSKKVATSLWRARNTAELDVLNAKFEDQRTESGCTEDGGTTEVTDWVVKPEVDEYVAGEIRNAAEASGVASSASGN